MKVLLFAAVVVVAVAYSSRRADETAKESGDRIRDVAQLLDRAVENGPPPRPTPASGPWINRVNAECERRERALERLQTPRSVDQIVRHAQEVLGVYRSHARRVSALNVPARFRGEAGTVNRLNRRHVQVLSRVAAAARSGGVSAASRQAHGLRVLMGDANHEFLRLGLPACAFTGRGVPL